jgi:hypothetical protein
MDFDLLPPVTASRSSSYLPLISQKAEDHLRQSGHGALSAEGEPHSVSLHATPTSVVEGPAIVEVLASRRSSRSATLRCAATVASAARASASCSLLSSSASLALEASASSRAALATACEAAVSARASSTSLASRSCADRRSCKSSSCAEAKVRHAAFSVADALAATVAAPAPVAPRRLSDACIESAGCAGDRISCGGEPTMSEGEGTEGDAGASDSGSSRSSLEGGLALAPSPAPLPLPPAAALEGTGRAMPPRLDGFRAPRPRLFVPSSAPLPLREAAVAAPSLFLPSPCPLCCSSASNPREGGRSVALAPSERARAAAANMSGTRGKDRPLDTLPSSACGSASS